MNGICYETKLLAERSHNGVGMGWGIFSLEKRRKSDNFMIDMFNVLTDKNDGRVYLSVLVSEYLGFLQIVKTVKLRRLLEALNSLCINCHFSYSFVILIFALSFS